MLNINKTVEDNLVKVELEGRLDAVTSPELDESLKEAVESVEATPISLEIDLEKLEYISSAGLRVLLAAQKVMNEKGDMKVTNVNEAVMEIFEVTGFAEILTIE